VHLLPVPRHLLQWHLRVRPEAWLLQPALARPMGHMRRRHGLTQGA